LTFVQEDEALTVAGPCVVVGGPTYTFDLVGTVDPETGGFSATGQLIGLCETPPGQATMEGTGDGEVFTSNAGCRTLILPVNGTKCGNGMIDGMEDCEDGNSEAGDCCSPLCTFEIAGSGCDEDRNPCTLDHCDGDGLCIHPLVPAGSQCTGDGNQCTDDVCDDAGTCLHPLRTGPCDDGSECTSDDRCSSGTCIGGPITPQCVGSTDLSGAWEVDRRSPAGGLSFVRRFEQDGAVLRSIVAGGATGLGSVNPATGEFEALTLFTEIIAECGELIEATVDEEGDSFSGTQFIGCGAFGTFGPFEITGHRCPSLTECACNTEASCIAADDRSRIAIQDNDRIRLARWRWSHTAVGGGFGDPQLGTEYRICAEDTAGGGVYFGVALDPEGWRPTRTGFAYASREGSLRRLTLKSNASRTIVAASFEVQAALSLPRRSPLRVRLLQRDAEQTRCFEFEFTDPSINTVDRYRAKD
jgi:cysteine-rich repeat protein